MTRGFPVRRLVILRRRLVRPGGAIYWHFKDKADLFNAMMDRVTLPLEFACGFRGAGAEEEASLWRLRGAMRAALHAVATDERVRRVFEIAMYKVEYVQELDAVRDRHVMACEGFRAKLRKDVVSAAKAQGLVLPMSADVAAMGLWALFDGLLQGWMLNRGGFNLLEVGRATVDAYLKGLGFELGAD